ncbi:MAG: methyltransferase domain-containing protein [Actinobacteria bacterium]|nr:methyltransferase domain-containing protein [Actinomycetota bacterium]
MGDTGGTDSHYFSEEPTVASRIVTYAFDGPGGEITVASDTGVFSHGALDKATAILIGHINALDPGSLAPGGDLLDLGCGAGPIALALAARFPARTVWAVDTNKRAVELCAANAVANGLGNIRACLPDDCPVDTSFVLVCSNPPVRIGKESLHDLLLRWFARISPGGRALLVVGRHLGSDSLQRWLGSKGFPATRLSSAKGFRVLEVRPAEG